MLSTFKASTLSRAGRLCRSTARPTAAICPTAASLAYHRPTKRHLRTNRLGAAGVWNSSKSAASPNGKGDFIRGHRMTSTSTRTEPQPERAFAILLLGLTFVGEAILVRQLLKDDTWLVPNVLETLEPDNRPPELVRLFIHNAFFCSPISLPSQMTDTIFRPCICHLDGLVTITFTALDQIKSPVVPTRMSMWLQTARVMEEEQPSGLRECRTAITLCAAVNTPRAELEGPFYSLRSWEPWHKWAQYEGPIIECLAREEAARKELYPPSDTTYSVVVVCRDGFMIFEYDGQQLHLKRDGSLGPVKRKFPSSSVIDYHWMSNPSPASSIPFADTLAKLRLDPFRFTLKPEQRCRHRLNTSS